MPLAMAPIGEKKVISMLKGKDDIKRRLQDLGFIKGEEIQILEENQSGIILLVKGVKIALNRGLASLIIVE